MIRRLRSVLKKTPFEMKYIDLNETVRQAIGSVTAVAHGRDIALKYGTTSADLDVKGDAVQLQQVFLNLIINAMDAISEAEAKEREVSVTTSLSGATAEIRISDTGPGIATGDLENVFDPFFTTKSQGMGMGLEIIRTIVEAHHGKISASQNQLSGGALFTIRLPDCPRSINFSALIFLRSPSDLLLRRKHWVHFGFPDRFLNQNNSLRTDAAAMSSGGGMMLRCGKTVIALAFADGDSCRCLRPNDRQSACTEQLGATGDPAGAECPFR